MSGRGTGDFLSGMYFSTYNCSDGTDNKEHYKKNDYYDGYPKLIKVQNKVYRVDFDIYKNLYRVKTTKHARALFETLKLINIMFHTFHGRDVKNKYDSSEYYLTIVHNSNKLGLNIPKYRDFIYMMEQASSDVNSENDVRSMSTRIMEYNGFNGVNVSGVEGFDNTLHGSVIYDLSKLSSTPKLVKNFNNYCETRAGVVGDEWDFKTQILRNSKIYDFYEFKFLPKNEQLLYLKRYKYIIPSDKLFEFDEGFIKMYYKILSQNLIKGIIKEEPTFETLYHMFQYGFIDVILNPNLKIGNATYLEYILTYSFKLRRYEIQGLIYTIEKNLNRELTEDEKISLEEVKSEVE